MSAQGTSRFYFVYRQTILLVNGEPLGRERVNLQGFSGGQLNLIRIWTDACVQVSKKGLFLNVRYSTNHIEITWQLDLFLRELHSKAGRRAVKSLMSGTSLSSSATVISNTKGAFASVVNECERTRDLSSLFQVFFFWVCVLLKASYTFSWKVSCYFEYFCTTFDSHESPYMTSDPARTFIHS